MQWERFATFNVLGAATWVVAVSSLGYLFGKHWQQLLSFARSLDLALAVAVLAVAGLWWRWRSNRSEGAKREGEED
jgi:membrane protein DedA with SNARE-associated domain